ncbi:hypothetical protein SAMN05421823_110226 [Catalinimonas alkaloidigena]|uniref:Small multi-drug export protein n=1 Tax=Catalinimonas alkaloidigena TaxID=1075417 RepID=A0A1G9QM94_9BACT|nr:hypothetical protein [Catalinimonas alkaloidigena]SDM12138.1 hypothetical protein SAMN05421823_110226 [Catalinimonas alkaloidigena]
MISELVKYVSVYLTSMVKFIAGPTTGLATGLTLGETLVFTVLGMMTSVVMFSLLGERLRKLWTQYFPQRKRKKLFTPRNRRIVTIWTRWGVQGVAFLTPVLFSPIIGTILAASFGAPKGKIVGYMLVSAIFWAAIVTVVMYYGFGRFVHPV